MHKEEEEEEKEQVGGKKTRKKEGGGTWLGNDRAANDVVRPPAVHSTTDPHLITDASDDRLLVSYLFQLEEKKGERGGGAGGEGGRGGSRTDEERCRLGRHRSPNQ